MRLLQIPLDRKSLTDPQRSIVHESTYSFQQFFLILLQVILVYVRPSIIQSDARKVAGNDFETVLPTCDTLFFLCHSIFIPFEKLAYTKIRKKKKKEKHLRMPRDRWKRRNG